MAFGVFGIYFFTAIYLQNVLGFSPTKAGLAFVRWPWPSRCSPAGPVAARAGTHRTVAGGMLLMAAGLTLISRLGHGATFADLMPGFLVFGAGAGLMNVPLANAILHAMPPDRSGIASALLNASREVAGLLGITVIGAVLRSRQGAALQHGTGAAPAFIDGFHAGLFVTIGLALAAVVVSHLALRRFTAAPADGIPADGAVSPEEAAAVLEGEVAPF